MPRAFQRGTTAHIDLHLEGVREAGYEILDKFRAFGVDVDSEVGFIHWMLTFLKGTDLECQHSMSCRTNPNERSIEKYMEHRAFTPAGVPVTFLKSMFFPLPKQDLVSMLPMLVLSDQIIG